MKKRPLLLAIGGLLAMAAGLGIGRFVYTPILPPMVEALQLTKSQAGLIASANFIGYLAGALLGALRLPGSRRTWLLAALAVNTICLAGMGAAATMPLFIALRLIAGAASAFVLIFSSALVLDRLAAAGRASLSAVHFAGVGGGIALSAILVAALLTAHASWQTLWFASAALSFAAVVAVAALVPPDEAMPQTARTQSAAGASPGFAALIVAYGLFGFGYVITATFIVDLVRGAPAIAHLEPYIWLVVGLSAVPSVALWTALGARWGVMRAYVVANLVEAVGVAASALWVQTAGVIVAAIFLGGTFVGLTALGLVAARQGSTGDPRRSIALMTVSFSLGQILGPIFAGYVYDATGSLSTPSLAAAAALVVAALLSLLAERQRRVAPSQLNLSK
ncbi:YbfB/YjiJ family MFS transporter [Reyranella massiliensis]|uniref:YbfB/YjiJ family MFS transporter n=1 Tax=Reyranella massiliensis TaxID=445220 RepID=UPI0005C29987|nr:YbfB/YjiJ family MFS transporter [Reyranella massiliensis]